MTPVNYFRPSEFACKCGRPECDAPKDPPASLLDPLNALRERIGRPLLITSGFRCAQWNQHEHGEPDSEHLTGEACDLLCASSPELWSIVHAIFAGAMPLFDRVGIGKTFVHVGVAPTHDHRVIWTYYGKAGTA